MAKYDGAQLPELGRLRQEDYEFEVSLKHIVKP
jgi:hypothetical protein